jgi:hypothetical protein
MDRILNPSNRVYRSTEWELSHFQAICLMESNSMKQKYFMSVDYENIGGCMTRSDVGHIGSSLRDLCTAVQ